MAKAPILSSLANNIPLLAFLAAAAILLILLQLPENKTEQPGLVPTGGADYYMQNFSITVTDRQGAASSWFSGTNLQHFPDNVTKIDKPQLTIRDARQGIWTSRAKTGEILNNNQITLDGKVQIKQVNINQPNVIIDTETLTFSLNQKLAQTTKPVTVMTPRGKIAAVGMKFDFAKNKLKLLSQVKADYAVN